MEFAQVLWKLSESYQYYRWLLLHKHSHYASAEPGASINPALETRK